MKNLLTITLFALLITFSFHSCLTNKAPANKTDIIFEQEVVLANASFRGADMGYGFSIVSGSSGNVFIMDLQNKKWQALNIEGTDSLDFRDVIILNKNEILLMSSGNGEMSRIYKSNDAGNSWKLMYKNEYPEAFFNSLDFWNSKHGVITSDPIDEKPYLLETKDGGTTWKRLQSDALPELIEGEYGFAASGTCIRTFANKYIRIATGGGTARILGTDDSGADWFAKPAPVISAKNSRGIFSIDFIDEKTGIAVGGDYTEDQLKGSNIALLNENGKWTLAKGASEIGFMSCVIYLGNEMVLATGTSGTAISYDLGENWKNLDDVKGYHTIAYEKSYNAGFLAGSNGRVRLFRIQ